MRCSVVIDAFLVPIQLDVVVVMHFAQVLITDIGAVAVAHRVRRGDLVVAVRLAAAAAAAVLAAQLFRRHFARLALDNDARRVVHIWRNRRRRYRHDDLLGLRVIVAGRRPLVASTAAEH